jgi:hypothetical protein
VLAPVTPVAASPRYLFYMCRDLMKEVLYLFSNDRDSELEPVECKKSCDDQPGASLPHARVVCPQRLRHLEDGVDIGLEHYLEHTGLSTICCRGPLPLGPRPRLVSRLTRDEMVMRSPTSGPRIRPLQPWCAALRAGSETGGCTHCLDDGGEYGRDLIEYLAFWVRRLGIDQLGDEAREGGIMAASTTCIILYMISDRTATG